MTRIHQALLHTGLIGSGVVLCAWAGDRVLGNTELQTPFNPFGINQSPYGEVFAMAMQGPINTDFHAGLFGKTPEQLAQQGAPPPESTETAAATPWSIGSGLESLIATMQEGHQQRTNPLPASDALKFFLRREAENKLRFAYRLDPSHYANYNALHFFLTEGITTRPELTPSAARLASETIDYCMRREHDPRPALTAAAACTNVLHLMFEDWHTDTPTYTTSQMRGMVSLLDECLSRYHRIARQWDRNGNWHRLSPQRIEECHNRVSFITNIRSAAVKTLQHLEKKERNDQNKP